MKSSETEPEREPRALGRRSFCGFTRGIGLFLAVLMAAILAGCQSDPPAPAGSANMAAAAPSPGTADYATNLLHEGDIVSITFQYATNFNAVQKITLDGLLNLDSAGVVKAAGKTPFELQNELSKIYKLQQQGDTVTVKLVSAVSRVYVSGAVFRPGPVVMERPLTALEAVMEAGGFDATRAKLSGVTVLRIESGREKAYHVNLERVLDGGDETPFYLRPFDIVHVPSKTFNF
jgi:polysaccharide biosynthesis/export protein